jgi:integrase
MAKGFIQERVTKKGEHRWDVVVNFKDPATGKWKRLWKTVDGSRKADRLKTKMLAEIDKGDFQPPTKMTVAVYLKEWLKELTTVDEKTLALYTFQCNKHIIPGLGAHPLTLLRAGQIQTFYSGKLQQGLSPRSVIIIHGILHEALKNATKTGLLSHNPCDNVTPPKTHRREMKTMQEEDIVKFLDEAKKGHYHDLFHMYLYTGIRRSELLSVRWSDVDLPGMTVSVNRTMQYIKGKVSFKQPKTPKSRRLIALSPDSCAVLKEHRLAQDATRKDTDLPPTKDSDLVFGHYDGSPAIPDTISHAWLRLVRHCGIEGVRLHDSRHTHASLLLKQGVHPKVVQERLGHSSISITLDTYSHTIQGMQKDAAAGFDEAIRGKKIQNNSLDSH